MNYVIYDIKCFVFAILCITLYVIFDKKTSKIQLIDIVMMIVLVIVSGARCNFGSDTYNYYIQYNNVLTQYNSFWDVLNSSYQSGFISLSYVIYKLTNFEYGLFWVVALIIYPTTIIYMRKKTEKPSVAFAVYLLMGFFVMSNNILKQYIAMLIIMIAYYSFLKKKRYIGYAVMIFLASKFHMTAVIAGILILIANKIKPNYRNLRICIIIGVLTSVLYNIVIPIIINNIPVLSKYSIYIGIERSYTTMLRGALNAISYVIMYLILTYMLIKNKEQIKDNSPENNYGYEQISFLFLAIMISIVAIRNQTINRIGLYLYQFIIFIVPNLFYIKFDYRKRQIYLTTLIILLMGWYGFNNIIGAENRYYDYSTYFNDIPKSYF